ncbi:hypothetical protein ACIBKX_32905 [Streptomyces sp. NPDC050658]|uniref:hypothetical protein n=1 Tax=unclassified Streptomyces TaxID=2593676 RepID=UPI0034214157
MDKPTEPGVLKLIDTPSGRVLADKDGYALYLQDAEKANTAPCVGECAINWPAATGYPTKADGVDGATGFTKDNPEGADKPQVIYNGHLLYYYKGDQPNEPKGQDMGGWSLVDAKGNALKSTEGSAPRRDDTSESPDAAQTTSTGAVRGSVEYISGTTQDSAVRPLVVGAGLLAAAAVGVGALLRKRREQDTGAPDSPRTKGGGR